MSQQEGAGQACSGLFVNPAAQRRSRTGAPENALHPRCPLTPVQSCPRQALAGVPPQDRCKCKPSTQAEQDAAGK